MRLLIINVFVLFLMLGCSPSIVKKCGGESGHNEIINAKDGTVLIEVKEGNFIMGSDEGLNDEKPLHTVYLDNYYIGKYEVTVEQFKKFWLLIPRVWVKVWGILFKPVVFVELFDSNWVVKSGKIIT